MLKVNLVIGLGYGIIVTIIFFALSVTGLRDFGVNSYIDIVRGITGGVLQGVILGVIITILGYPLYSILCKYKHGLEVTVDSDD